MADILSTIFSSLGAKVDTRNKQAQQTGEAGSFDALLFNASVSGTTDSVGDTLNSLIDGLIENIMGSRGMPGTATQPVTPPKFPFSQAFESTFGLSGPLPEYITMITAKLGLNAAQNQSLQDISIRNKDIVKTPDSVRGLALELKAAGIPPQTATSA